VREQGSSGAPSAPLGDLHALFFLGGASGAALLPFFALLLKERGLSPALIGLVLAVANLAGGLAGPVWGHFADVGHGKARILRLSSWASAAAAIAFLPTGSSLAAIVAAAALLYACSGAGAPLEDALAVDLLGPGRLGAYGRVRLWASLGWAIAVVAFGALYEGTDLALVMPAYAAMALLFGLWTYRLHEARPAGTVHTGSRLGAAGATVRAAPKLLPFSAGAFLMSAGWSAALAFLGLRIVGQGGGPFLVGFAAGLTAVVEIPVMLATGPLGRRIGLRAMYLAGAAVNVALFSVWALVSDPTVLAVLASLEGVSFALVYVSQVVLVGRLVPAGLLASGQSLFSGIVRSAAPIAGILAGGVVFERLGPPALFAGCAGLVALGATVVWLVLAGVDAAAAPPHVAPPPAST